MSSRWHLLRTSLRTNAAAARIVPRRYASTSSHRNPNPGNLDPDSLFNIPPPPKPDFPPISQRLRPLVPFLVYWTALTSLAFHLLRVRKESDEQMERKNAQISVLEGLIRRLGAEPATITEEEVQRELEMVGLRERPGVKEGGLEQDLREAGNVGWREVLLGRKRVKRSEEEQEKAAEDEWRAVINSATSHIDPPAAQDPRQRAAIVEAQRRAPSSSVYAM